MTGAVMEATGIYWEKVYDVLSDAGLDVMVVHAQHVKQIKHPCAESSVNQGIPLASE